MSWEFIAGFYECVAPVTVIPQDFLGFPDDLFLSEHEMKLLHGICFF
jgi:hypothetical protein